MPRRFRKARVGWWLCCALSMAAVQAQDEQAAAERPRETAADRTRDAQAGGNGGSKDEPKTIAEITADSDRHDGIFTAYRDRKSGALRLALRPDQLDREYIYLAVTADGIVQTNHFRGSYRDNRVVTLERHFDRIELRSQNTAFYYHPENPLSRAAHANVSPAVLAVAKIVAEDPDSGEMLIEVDGFLLDESLHQVKPTPDPDQGPREAFRLGDLNRDRSRVVEVRNYPLNMAVRVEYVYRNPAPLVRGGAEVTDSRYVSLELWHHFVPMPENGYQPRLADYRLGHFAERVTDLTSDSVTPYRDLVQRWNLRKRDPDAALSEPLEPIVWWIENTTPMEFRDTIRDAVLAWNSSFEKIGYRNAIEVRVQPDDADWDAGDVRYNVLRWASSPSPPFAGYGPSFTNPRTGEILGADVMLEYAGVTRNLQQQRVLDALEPGAHAPSALPELLCTLGAELHASQLFGRFAIDALGMDAALGERLIHEYLSMLALHEVGHTLGFMHNFAASRLLGLDEVHDPEVAGAGPLTGSVMDYADVHLPAPGRERTAFFQTMPGPYDDWVVEYAYSDAVADPVAEQARLAAIAERSTDPRLAFGNDADDMRAPGRAIDPRVNVYDLSSDPIGYALERIALVDELLGKAVTRHARDGQSYHELADAYTVLLSQLARSVMVISRYVGGVEVNHAARGQPGAEPPFVPVAADQQRRAVQALAEHLFAPSAFAGGADLYRHLQRQRRLFDFFGTTQDPKLHEWLLSVQRGVLNHLLHPTVLRRVTDSRLYGNEYGLAELLEDLTRAVFEEDLRSDVGTFRQNLQLEYVHRLTRIVSGRGNYDYPSQSMALYQLRAIQRSLRGKRGGAAETRAHTQNVLFVIERALEAHARG